MSASAVAPIPATAFRLAARLTAPLAGGVLTFVILASVSWSYVGSGFLVLDDTIILGRATAGAPVSAQNLLNIRILNAVGENTHSVLATKLTPVVLLALAAAMAAAMLTRVLGRPIVAVILGSAVTLVPVSAAVGPWATGAHPEMAAPLVLAGIWIAWGSWNRKASFDPFAATAAATLFAVASLISPTATLLVLLYPLWAIGVAALAPTRRRGIFLALVSSALPGFLALRLALSYHYGDLVGWVDRSPARAWTNVREAVGIVVDAPVGTLARVVIGAGLVVVAIAAFRTYRRTARPAISQEPAQAALVWFALAAASLSLIPGLAVVSYQPRYVSLGAMLGAFALAAALPPAASQAAGERQPYLVVGAAVVLLGFTLAATPMRSSVYGVAAEQHRSLRTGLDQASTGWDDDAQIVVAVARPGGGVSFGFNHWSTWYVRSVTDRTDVIALVGWEGLLNESPFVSAYADHDPEYWSVVDGVSARAQMRGLELGRPTYAYALDGEGRLIPMSICFSTDDRAWLLEAGEMPGLVNAEEGEGCQSQSEEVIDWSVEAGALSS